MSNYSIQLLETSAGYRFNYQHEHAEKIITWAGSDEAMNIENPELAKQVQKSLEDHPIWYDENDNLIIPSPLYFMLSLAHNGIRPLLEQLENRALFWSQDAFFHLHSNPRIAAAQEGVSAPVKNFLADFNLKPIQLKDAEYDNWEELEDGHFLPDVYLDVFNNLFDALSPKEQCVMLYFVFNSPHFVSVLAWLNTCFKNDEEFAHYTLVMEGIVSPVNMQPQDFEKEIQLRVNMFADVHHFLNAEL